jgi:small membrane protein
MRLFQYIAVAILAIALGSEAIRMVRGRRASAAGLVRGLAWSASALAILFPGLVQSAALALGIRRGTDLLLYVFIILSMFVFFSMYASHQAVRRQLTELIRLHAIEHARRAGGAPVANRGESPRRGPAAAPVERNGLGVIVGAPPARPQGEEVP